MSILNETISQIIEESMTLMSAVTPAAPFVPFTAGKYGNLAILALEDYFRSHKAYKTTEQSFLPMMAGHVNVITKGIATDKVTIGVITKLYPNYIKTHDRIEEYVSVLGDKQSADRLLVELKIHIKSLELAIDKVGTLTDTREWKKFKNAAEKKNLIAVTREDSDESIDASLKDRLKVALVSQVRVYKQIATAIRKYSREINLNDIA